MFPVADVVPLYTLLLAVKLPPMVTVVVTGVIVSSFVLVSLSVKPSVFVMVAATSYAPVASGVVSVSDQVEPLRTIAGDVLAEYCTPFTTTVSASPVPTVAVPVIVGVVDDVLSAVTVTGPAGRDAITVAR